MNLRTFPTCSRSARLAHQVTRRRRLAFTIWMAALSVLCFARSSAAAEKPAWIRDLDAGKKEARDSAKDLLIVFSGHGWCAHCDLLDREVFQQALFVEPAKRHYVFVELDFTFGDTQEEKARESRYRKLSEKYLVRSFPTVV